MQIDIITLFPEMFKGSFDESIVGRAVNEGRVEINIHHLRNWAVDERGTVDDKPYGGGPGMLLRPEPIFEAVEAINESRIKNQEPSKPSQDTLQAENPKQKAKSGHDNEAMEQLNNETIKQFNHSAIKPSSHVVLLDAGGKLYNQQKAQQLSKLSHLILIAGHYEGVDYRVHEYLADEIISIGDYILTGGEIPAMVIADSVVRLLPGVLDPETTEEESFSLSQTTRKHTAYGLNTKTHTKGQISNIKYQISLLEYPQYTRPEEYRGHKVPKILLSGNHAEIAKWQREKALERTKQNRPDLLKADMLQKN